MDSAARHPDQIAAVPEALVSRVVHDLRACLRAVATLPDWVREDLEDSGQNMPPEVSRHLNAIECQAARADALILAMREYYCAGASQRPKSAVNLADVVATVIERSKIPARTNIINLIEPGQVYLNEAELERVLQILITNAVAHNCDDVGQITVLSRSPPTVLRISDAGPGIPHDMHDKVFEPLVTLRARDVVEGSGMGLAIARKMVTAWGGTLCIAKDHKGRGTSFELTFPD